MGKQANYLGKRGTQNIKKQTRRNKNKSEDVISTFLNKLQEQDSGTTSSIVLHKIHKFIKKNKKISKKMNFEPIKQRLKICKKCDCWNVSIDIVQCLICEDYYHKQCFKKSENDTIICQSCNKKDQLQKNCKECLQKGNSLAQCKSCNFWFHPQCLNKTKTKCKKCHKIMQSNSQRQSQLEQFMTSKDIKVKKQIEQSTNTHPIRKDQGKFTFVNLIRQPKDIIKYKFSLQSAIEKKKMTYTQDLINLNEHLNKAHEDSLDFGIQFMNKAEIQAYKNYKKQPIGPFHLNLLADKGFDVVADREIPYKSLICEYIGEIVTLRQCVYLQSINKNDSLMELQSGKNSDQTLIIRPQKYTNIARFINGIKKNSPKANIQTIRMLYQGMPVVLLVASRTIKKGESLAYDYNAGGIQAQYDTSHFV